MDAVWLAWCSGRFGLAGCTLWGGGGADAVIRVSDERVKYELYVLGGDNRFSGLGNEVVK
eukprot:scaffold13926_cov58-Phaeocystis_antarctica.AAC.2